MQMPLIERESQLTLALRFVESPPSLILIEGVAGSGKSRLLRDLLARAPGAQLLGRCVRVRDPFRYGPVVEALARAKALHPRMARGRLAGTLRTLVPEIPPGPSPAHETTLSADTHTQFRSLLEAITLCGPAVLALDDLQWTDDATAEFVRYLVAIGPPQLSIVVTYRSNEVASGSLVETLADGASAQLHCTRVSLPPLTRAGVRLIIEDMHEGIVPERVIDFVYERTGGSPLAVAEVLTLMGRKLYVHGRRLRTDEWDHLEDLGIPRRVRDTVLQRAHEVSEDARSAIEAIAVLGKPADPAAVHALTNMSEDRVVQGLSDACDKGLIRIEFAGFDFEHGLARDAIYDVIPVPRRQVMHRRAADTLRNAGLRHVGQLERHLRASGDREAWVDVAEDAADAAADVGDYSKAFRLYQELLEVNTDDPQRRAAVAGKLGDVAVHCRAHGDAIPLLRAALSSENSPGEQTGGARVALARLLFQAGDIREAWAEMQKALDSLADSAAAAEAMRLLAYPWRDDVPLSTNLSWLERATDLARGLGDDRTDRAVAVDRATVLTAVGDRAGWLTFEDVASKQAEVWWQREQRLRLLVNGAQSALIGGYYARCRELLDELRRAASAEAYVRFDPVAEGIEMMLNWMTGEWQVLPSPTDRAALADSTSPSASVEFALVTAHRSLTRGHLQEAEDRLNRVVRVACASGDLFVALTAIGARVRILLGRGETQLALAEARKGIKIVRETEIWLWGAELVPWVAQLHSEAGRKSEALDLLDDYALKTRDLDAPITSAASSLLRAFATDGEAGEEAVDAAYEAEQQYAELPRPYEASLAQALRGEILVRRGNTDLGIEALKGAQDALAALEATWDVARIQRRARALGIRLEPRRGRRGYGAELSPRETEVVKLVSLGRTNREVAEALFLSPRTVERHVFNAMRKLRVASRADLAAATQGSIA